MLLLHLEPKSCNHNSSSMYFRLVSLCVFFSSVLFYFVYKQKPSTQKILFRLRFGCCSIHTRIKYQPHNTAQSKWCNTFNLFYPPHIHMPYRDISHASHDDSYSKHHKTYNSKKERMFQFHSDNNTSIYIHKHTPAEIKTNSRKRETERQTPWSYPYSLSSLSPPLLLLSFCSFSFFGYHVWYNVAFYLYKACAFYIGFLHFHQNITSTHKKKIVWIVYKVIYLLQIST